MPPRRSYAFLTIHLINWLLSGQIKWMVSDGQSCRMPGPTHKKSLQSKNSDLRDMGVFLHSVKASFLFGGVTSLFSSVISALFVHQ